jgi:hypothetical protein
MKVSRKSWHYRLLIWFTFNDYPSKLEITEMTTLDYITSVWLAIIAIIILALPLSVYYIFLSIAIWYEKRPKIKIVD